MHGAFRVAGSLLHCDLAFSLAENLLQLPVALAHFGSRLANIWSAAFS